MERYDRLPLALRNEMKRYIKQRIRPSDFLMAVLLNDLREACLRADETNRHLLWEIVAWLFNEAPASCWGSPAKVAAWLAKAEQQRQAAAAEGG